MDHLCVEDDDVRHGAYVRRCPLLGSVIERTGGQRGRKWWRCKFASVRPHFGFRSNEGGYRHGIV